jgi:type II secretory pathway component PulF
LFTLTWGQRCWWGTLIGIAVYVIAQTKILKVPSINRVNVEDFILGMTVIGAIIDVFFRPFTYFEQDTAAMFERAVNGAMMEVIDSLSREQGIPLLPPEDRKPVMTDFFKK